MPLGKCPDCNYEVSSNARRCPKCGNDHFLKDISTTAPEFCGACDGSGIATLVSACTICSGTGIQYRTHHNLLDIRNFPHGRMPFVDEQAILSSLNAQMPARKAKRIDDIQKQLEEARKSKRSEMIYFISYLIGVALVAAIIGIVIYGLVVFFYQVFDGQRIDRSFNQISWSRGVKWGLLAGLVAAGIMSSIYYINRNKYRA